jgi:hypothetical protein
VQHPARTNPALLAQGVMPPGQGARAGDRKFGVDRFPFGIVVVGKILPDELLNSSLALDRKGVRVPNKTA